MAGRPTKLTKEVHNTITEAIALGVTYKNAVGAAGISYQCFLDWLERGKKTQKGELNRTKANKIYLEFFESVERSKHKAFSEYTKTIHKAAKEGDWRAAESFLKRRDPDNWGDRQENTIKTDTIEVSITKKNEG